MRKLVFILILAFSISGCKKEEILNRGELNGKEILELAANNQITKIDLYLDDWQKHNFQPYSIEGQFLIVGKNYYDLNQLVYFGIDGSGYYTVIAIYLE